jgi:glycosyltransferase involved in cell wall biosynthesis
MKGSLDKYVSLVVIVSPSAEVVSGSLLRPINIYYSLKGFKNIRVDHVPVRKTPSLLLQLSRILRAGVIIVSGVNPWISASIATLGRVLRKEVLTDFHGFSWLEASLTNAVGPFMRRLLLVSEKISYKLSRYVVVASQWLAKVLNHYFGERRSVVVLENAVPCIFEEITHKLMKSYDLNMLRRYVCERVLHRNDCFDKLLFIAPLPSVFESNILAYRELLKLRSLLENVMIIVTGIKRTDVFDFQGNIIPIGYVSYVDYVALLLSSDGIILPYPSNAICGGIRNKVLEAGFCAKPVISTKTGMMHLNAVPNFHYVLIDDKEAPWISRKDLLKEVSEKLGFLVKENYSFKVFREKWTRLIALILQGRR